MAATRPSDEEIERFHRWFAAGCNNRGWVLAEQPVHSSDELRELLFCAYAAAHHWSKVGTAVHVARAELLLVRAHVCNQHGELSMQYARRAFDFITGNASEAWEVAFAHAALADAAAACGVSALHRNFHASAKALGAALADADDRAVFDATFIRIPSPST